ncbi:NUDIX hydrolase [soil metagenome]|jgi:ADP-ribose pyrophosphatase
MLPGQIASRRVHRGKIVDLRLDTVRFPDGTTGEMEMIRHSGAAAVVPLLGHPADRDPEILLIHQYRYAADGFIWEIPAGRPARPGEPWGECAQRELEEETGYRAGVLRPLTSIHTTPGFTDERIHLFLAAELSPGAHARDIDEFMEIRPTPLSRALEMVRDGTISDAKTISGLLYAALFIFAS